MSDVYELHSKAFAAVAAYAVLKDGQPVAKVAFKYPRDGAGRLFAYVHWVGLPMTRGFASGGNYDKASAAVSAAVGKTKPRDSITELGFGDDGPDKLASYSTFRATLSKDDGAHWDNRLRDAGFDVFQVV